MDRKLSDQLQRDHESGDFGRALDGYSRAAERLERENEVLRIERDHARAKFDKAIRHLVGIHGLLYPPLVTREDGKVFMFKSPYLHEQMQALSDRIRALPDEIEKMREG